MSRRKPIVLMVVGGVLALGPLWGLLGTVIGMVQSFDSLSGGGTADQLAHGISLSLWTTVGGLVVCPIGLVLLAIGIVWTVRLRRPAADDGRSGAG